MLTLRPVAVQGVLVGIESEDLAMLCSCSALLGFAAAAVALPRPQQPVVSNTALARPVTIANIPQPGPGRAFRVTEAGQGMADLNGDGDAADHVLHIVPQASGPVLAVGLASDDYGPALAGRWVALAVPESAQGGGDLNGDGDAGDAVLHLVDSHVGSVSVTGMAASGARLALSERYAAFAVSEVAQGGIDLNGDGNTFDLVLHHVDIAGGAITNVGLEVSTVAIEGNLIHGLVFEFFYGQDLNGDGDLSDNVPYLVDAEQGTVLVLTSAANSPIQATDGFVVYAVLEASVGADLNGDGDLGDLVTQVLDVAAGTTTNTGLAQHTQLLCEGPYVALVVPEGPQGADLNGDGDLGDFVVHSVHLPTVTATNTGLSGSIVGIQGRLLTLRVSESFQSLDLNGDGDALDSVVHVVRLGSGSVTNLGLMGGPIALGGRLIGFEVRESDQGMRDLNGDGDTFDWVWHVHDAAVGTTTNLGTEVSLHTTDIAGEDFLIYGVREGVSGVQDLNGDGDTDDSVLHLLRPDLPPQNLALDVVGPAWFAGRRVLFAVREAKQGSADLNGDGDTSDQVVHVLDVP